MKQIKLQRQMQTAPKPYKDYEMEYLKRSIERIRDAGNPVKQLDEELKNLKEGDKIIDGFKNVYDHLESLKQEKVPLRPTRLDMEIKRISDQGNDTSSVLDSGFMDVAVRNFVEAAVLISSPDFNFKSGAKNSGFIKGA